jgi:hypothetical protein
MNDDSSLRSSRVMLTAGIVICSLLAVVSFMNLRPGRLPHLLSVGAKSSEATEANRQLSDSDSEFYPDAKPSRSVPVHAISQSTERTLTTDESISIEPKSPAKHRDVFKHDQIVDAENVAQHEFRKSLRHFSTTTVVEKNGTLNQDPSASVSAAPSQNSVESSPAVATTATPHITVPVTVNVDNGEILSELMRIQEQVLVTRSQLEDVTLKNQQRSKEAASSAAITSTAMNEQFHASTESTSVTQEQTTAKQTAAEPATVNTKTAMQVAAAPKLAKPVAQPIMEEPEVPEFSAFEPEPRSEVASESAVAHESASSAMVFEPTETTEQPVASQESTTEELPELDDFAEPNAGPAEKTMEEDLPAFDLPTQSSRRQHSTSVNSYAEWIRSFEETHTTAAVVPASFQEEQADELPELASFDVGTDSAEAEDESSIREFAAPLAQVPEPKPEPVAPATPVPPLPVRTISRFHEAATNPVFPFTDPSAEPVPATPEFDSASLTIPSTSPSDVSPSSRPSNRAPITMASGTAPERNQSTPSKSSGKPTNQTSANKVASTNSNRRASSNKAAAAAAQRRAAAATGKPQSSGHRPEGQNTKGMLTRMKSSFSNAVARVPKPDLDTPMWVDRLADWKDERFGKKNTSAPETAAAQQAIASNQQAPTPVQSPAQQHVAATRRPERRSTSRPAGATAPTASTANKVAGSGFRPRPNVTTVPRSGASATQMQTAQVESKPMLNRLVASNVPSAQPKPTQVQPNPTQPQPTQRQDQLQLHAQVPQATVSRESTQAPPSAPSPRSALADAQPQQPVQKVVPTAAPPKVANAAYRQDSSQPSTAPVSKASFASPPHVPPAIPQSPPVRQTASSDQFGIQPSTFHQVVVESSPTQPSVATHTYEPVPHPNAYATLQPRQTTTRRYASSQHAYGKPTAVPPMRKATRTVAATEPSEYVGTLDAFNMRMTMVVRPPSMANFGMRPVSQWFSGPNSMEPAESSPTLHRVSSTMRYAAQPKTIR